MIMMVQTAVRCIHCKSKKVVKYGTQANGTPRCKCKECGKTFQLEYLSAGASPEIKMQIVKMALNGSGMRDISRVLGVSRNTVDAVLKKLKTFLST